MENLMYGEWNTLDSSWDPGNKKGIYSITSEYSGHILLGTAKLDYITVKKKVSLFKTEKIKYTIDKIKKISLIEEVISLKSGTIGIEFKDKKWITTKFDLRNRYDKIFFRLLLDLVKAKPVKNKKKAPF